MKVVQVIMLVPKDRLLTLVLIAVGLVKIPPAGAEDQVPVVAPVMLLAANTVVGVLKQTV